MIILTITYSARVAIINNLVKTQLSLAEIKITCLDISLASNMTIMVNQLCLQSPKADIDIFDMTVQWQYSRQFSITDLDVRLADIKGTEHLFSNTKYISQGTKQQSNSQQSNKPRRNNQDFSQLLSTTLRAYTEQIRQFKLPIKVNITEISYLPFTDISKPETPKVLAQAQRKRPYRASLSVVDNNLSFLLRNAENIAFIKAKLTKNKHDFSIALSSKLDLLKSFATTHQLPITTALQNALHANEISGNVDALIEYQAGSVSMHNQLRDLIITSENGIGKSGAFKLSGALNFQSRLNLLAKEVTNKIGNQAKSDLTDKDNAQIKLTFVGKNEISLEYSAAQLLTLLEESELAPPIISLLNDNPLANLTLKLQDSATLSLNNKKAYLSQFEISARGDKRTHQLTLEHITFALPDEFADRKLTLTDSAINDSAINDSHANTLKKPKQAAHQSIQSTKIRPHALTIERFILDSQLNLAGLAKFTPEPVVIHLAGSLKQNETQTTLILTEPSSITVNNLTAFKAQNNAKNNLTAREPAPNKPKTLLDLNTFTAKLTGSLQRLENNPLSLQLTVHGQGAHLKIPEILHLKSFELSSQINGKLDDIQMNTTAQADGVDLGTIVITGPVLSPKIQVAANKLPLTDLLSLDIQLPAKIELINGALDYSVSGQLADLSNLGNTPFDVSVAVTAASGEVDGIWLQELNWQQNFTLLSGKITTKPNVEENLTVALIETPTPISKLSMNTHWTFNKSFKLSASKLKADVLGGSFYIPKIHWPFEQSHSVNVQLHSIDLAQAFALEKKQGVVVTGNISGQIPVTFESEKYIIEDGELHNISNGLIQIIDNPAVAALKANNSQLALAFDALQNLHYDQLSSAVSMGEDGYMLLETVIKGRNPDINNDVNLNLNLSYDLLGLLESLSITSRFEKNIIKGLQKNKE